MYQLFLISAIVGGTVFVVQFVMSIVGIGGDDVAGDLPDDIPDDIPGDIDFDADADIHGSTTMFGVLSFRTIVAALTFFGLAGLASMDGGLSDPLSLVIALAAGVLALYVVHYLMRLMYRLRHDSTVRIERTVGQRGTVYIPIPASGNGQGKIQIRTQGRIMEYAAQTPVEQKLATGTIVEVTCVLTPTTVEVEPVDPDMIKDSIDDAVDDDSVA